MIEALSMALAQANHANIPAIIGSLVVLLILYTAVCVFFGNDM